MHTLGDLAALGTLPGASEALLRALVRGRLAFLVTGGTGSGKTTLLSALLGEVDPAERMVLCEDATELAPAHPHVVRLLTRPANVEGAGQVTLRDLVRQALRMRPDRLVVGEVRGAEMTDLLAALNTGHDGGCGTLHANRPAEVPARLEALGVAAGLGRDAVHSQLAAALAVVVHLRRTAEGRRVEELGVVRRAGDLVVVEPGWRADGGPCPARGPAGASCSAADGRRDRRAALRLRWRVAAVARPARGAVAPGGALGAAAAGPCPPGSASVPVPVLAGAGGRCGRRRR